MGLALTACDGYKEPNPPAQYNPQEPILQASDVRVESQVSSGEVYNMTDLIADKENIKLATITCDDLPEGYDFGAIAYVSADDFKTSSQVATEVKASGEPNVWDVEVIPDSLQQAYNDNISTEEKETTLEIRFLATTVKDSQQAIIGGADNYYGPYSIKIMPAEPARLEMPGPFLYTPGGSNGWNAEQSQWLYTTDDGVTFQGFALLEGEFKFADTTDWSGINYGASEEEGLLSTDGGAGNLTAPVNGLYWCKVNVEELTYQLTLISSCGVIGGFNNWEGDADLNTSNNLVWSGDVDFPDGGEFKFRFNGDWAVNLGGESFKYLVYDGPNLHAPGSGSYTVTLDLSRLPYSCTVIAK